MLGVLWVASLTAGAASVALAAEPGKAPAADKLPMHLIKVLRTTNKAQTNRYVPKVYDIDNTNPYALLRWIRRTAQIEEGAFYFFGKPDESGKVNSGKIMVTLPEHMLPGVDKLMATIDRAGLTSTSGETFHYFRPKHRHVDDDGFIDILKAVRGGSGDFETDKEANMVLVYAAPSKIEDVKLWTPLIDAPPPQVMIEATVYEINVDNESEMGLDYVNWKNGPGRNLFAAGAFKERETFTTWDNPGPGNPLFNSGAGDVYGLPGHGWSASGTNTAYYLDVSSAFFDFLVVKGKARVMTAAKLAARNLETASLFSGDTILYYKTQNGPAPLGGARPQCHPLDPNDEPEDDDGDKTNEYPDNRTVVGAERSRMLADKSGVSLEITPTIAKSEINLKIETSVVSHTGFDSNGVPVLVGRETDTELRLRDGQEVVLAGYTRELFLERADKIPWLGSLPLIGYLFGGDGNTTERRQVVIVLTPHVVKDFSAMEYDPTRINAALIKSKALRKADVDIPKTEVGFDQWLLDAEQ